MMQRAILDVEGVVEEGHPLGAFLPPIVQANADGDKVKVGDTVYVTIKCRVQQLIPGPTPLA